MDDCVVFECSARGAIRLQVRRTSGWCCSAQTVGLACYHKIAESMWHEEHNCLSSSGAAGKRPRRVETNEADSPVS